MNHAKPSLSIDKEGHNHLKPIQLTMSKPEHPTLAINRSLHRLPLILDILDEIETGKSHLGDDDLRQGSHQAVQRMVDRLKDIKIAHISEANEPPKTELEIASTWLLGERPRKVLPSSLYDELSELIQKLLPGHAEILSSHDERIST